MFADLKSFSALGAYGCGVVTALTAQNTRVVDAVSLVDPAFVAQQLDTLFADVRIDALKIGMLGSAGLIDAVADRLQQHARCPVVLDPVMVAKSGDALLQPQAVAALRERLLPLATLITPNLPEAAVLLGGEVPRDLPQMRRAAAALHRLLSASGPRWVLLKGGHLEGAAAIDLLHDGDRMIELTASRVATRNTHGTGCSLSAAITALLPRHAEVPVAVRLAKDWLTSAIGQADLLQVGGGHGPVHHFHQWWSDAR